MRWIYQSNNKRIFLNFRRFLKKNGPFDVIIDGLNVGFHKGKFLSELITSVVSYFEESLFENKLLEPKGKRRAWKVLVLARNHVLYYPSLQELYDAGKLYCVPTEKQDDLYWLFAAVSSDMKVYCVTNDLMKDHEKRLGREHEKNFLRWKRASRISYAFRGNPLKLHISFPVEQNPVVQEGKDLSVWHVPLEHDSWLCVRLRPPRL